MVNEVTAIEKEVTLDTAFVKREGLLRKGGVKAFIWGSYGIGKTFFSLSFPEPIYVISTEYGVTQLLNQFPDKDIRVMECTVPYTDAPKKLGKVDEGLFATDPEVSLRNVEKATELLKDITKGTIVLDSGTDLWEWFSAWIDYNADKYTGSGTMMRTEWGKVNSKYKNLLMRLISRPVNFVMTGRSQKVYGGDGKESSEEKFSGQKNTPFIPDIVLHLEQRPKAKVDPASGKILGSSLERFATIEKNRFGESGQHLTDPTYDSLKKLLDGKVPDYVFGT